MNDEYKLPSGVELNELPKSFQKLYALRCIERVQPLAAYCNDKKVFTSRFFHRWFSYEDALFDPLKLNQISELAVPVVVTESHKDEVDIYLMVFNLEPNSIAQLAVTAKDSASAIVAALHEGVSEIASIGLDSLKNSHDIALRDFTKAASLDLKFLKYVNKKTRLRSVMKQIGDLWHGSPPDWYIESKAYYDKTIPEWEYRSSEEGNEKGNLSGSANITFSSSGKLSSKLSEEIESEIDADLARRIESSEPEPLISVYFDDSGFTENEISECLEYLSEAYRSLGGVGLKLVNGTSLLPETEEVSR